MALSTPNERGKGRRFLNMTPVGVFRLLRTFAVELLIHILNSKLQIYLRIPLAKKFAGVITIRIIVDMATLRFLGSCNSLANASLRP